MAVLSRDMAGEGGGGGGAGAEVGVGSAGGVLALREGVARTAMVTSKAEVEAEAEGCAPVR